MNKIDLDLNSVYGHRHELIVPNYSWYKAVRNKPSSKERAAAKARRRQQRVSRKRNRK